MNFQFPFVLFTKCLNKIFRSKRLSDGVPRKCFSGNQVKEGHKEGSGRQWIDSIEMGLYRAGISRLQLTDDCIYCEYGFFPSTPIGMGNSGKNSYLLFV